ncbi:MAG: D-aminoacylase, partial [Gammaproteobacteria bacterium]|nr:D-aminoacylase [Gammaproteobacteria bacterium]MYK28572.1 D-aminoacylase [Gammaproteobacteria bacterium]
MAHDLVVRGGQLVDGAGGEPRLGDLAIDDGLITAVGEVSGRGRREIDAEGHMVTPGFVDI